MVLKILSTLGRALAYMVIAIVCLVALVATITGPVVLFHNFVTDVQTYVIGFLAVWIMFLLGLTLAVVENFDR